MASETIGGIEIERYEGDEPLPSIKVENSPYIDIAGEVEALKTVVRFLVTGQSIAFLNKEQREALVKVGLDVKVEWVMEGFKK